jgi:16S rRNA (guanine966-N2)-methyltransferase
MADKIKGALFNALSSLAVEPDRVLDLYAGTGGIGIEALSRGARWADFVDHGRDAAAVIRRNLDTTGLADRSRVHLTPVDRFVAMARESYDFVIIDPPYADPGIVKMLGRVGASALVQCGTIVVIGHSPRVELPERIGPLDRLRHRCHGDSCFSIYEVIDAPGGDGGDPAADPHGEG